MKLFNKRGWIENNKVEKMLGYKNTGFSLDAKVKIHAFDEEVLEKLIRYCARPAFVSDMEDAGTKTHDRRPVTPPYSTSFLETYLYSEKERNRQKAFEYSKHYMLLH